MFAKLTRKRLGAPRYASLVGLRRCQPGVGPVTNTRRNLPISIDEDEIAAVKPDGSPSCRTGNVFVSNGDADLRRFTEILGYDPAVLRDRLLSVTPNDDHCEAIRHRG
jgi:hypothetical protein